MKAKHVFLTMGLALVMGAGIAASGVVSMAKGMQPARAGSPVNLYFDVSSASWWNNDGAETYAHCFGGGTSTTWPGAQMSLVAGSSTRYVVEVDDACTQVIFTRVNPSDHTTVWNRTSKEGGTAINLPADYTVSNQWNLKQDGSSYDDGNCCGHWSLYTPPAVTHQVNVYVDGVLAGGAPQTIGDGELPEAPALTEYGKGFDGWYSDASCTGAKVTEITSDTSVYGETYKLPEWSYKIDSFPVSSIFTDVYVYAFESNGRYNDEWPGVEYDGSSFIVPNDATIVINNGNGAQTVDIEQSWKANDILRISTEQDGSNNYLANWKSDLDEPNGEGYYISGEFSSNPCWTYDDSEQMTNTTGENVAYEMNFLLAVGDEMRVRSFYTDRYPYDQWATLGDNGYASQADPADNWGEKSGDNFKATKAGYYDVYAKYEDHNSDGIKESFMFYVAEHVDSYDIEMTAVMFEGPTKLGTEVQATQKAYSGSNFEPVQPDMSGFAKRGYYTDADCTIAYEPTKFSADGHLYAKYTKVGFYMISESTSWSIDAAVSMSTTDLAPTDKAQITLTVAAANEKHSFVYYNASGAMEGHSGLGAAYTFASTDEDNNIVFSEANTYYIYWSSGDNKIYIETVSPDMKKALAFVRDFRDSMAEACSSETQEADVKAAWAEAANAYKTMKTSEAAAAALVEQGGYSSDAEIREFAERYIYIYQHHASWNLENFMGWEISASTNSINGLVINNNVLLITVISVSTLAVSAGLILFLLKRKRLVK